MNSQGVYPHFQTADGEVVYCYNWDWPAPDAIGTEYNEYKFYDGMKEITGDQVKVDEVAAAMLAGYHKDVDTGKYNVAPQFQSLVDDSYQDFLQGRNDPSSPFYGIKIPTPYTKEEFEQDVTQSVIWKVNGASSASGERQGLMASYTKLGQAILSYAENHPLDQQTAFPKNVTVITKTDGGTVSESNPLVMDPSTKLSQSFEISNYNGEIDINNLPSGYVIVDANGNPVSQVQGNETYRIKYIGNGNPSSSVATDAVNKITVKASYEAIKKSTYFSAVMQNNVPGKNNPYQNMVNLETTTENLIFPVTWSSKSSSSSSSSSSLGSTVQKEKQNTNKGVKHGMPQTGEALATSLVAIGVALLGMAGMITLRKQK